jgi:hypothetical protein
LRCVAVAVAVAFAVAVAVAFAVAVAVAFAVAVAVAVACPSPSSSSAAKDPRIVHGLDLIPLASQLYILRKPTHNPNHINASKNLLQKQSKTRMSTP